MPLNVRRFSSAVVGFLLVSAGFVIFTGAQTVPPAQSAANAVVTRPSVPTSGDVMRERIAKSKAFIAVRNYNAAIYELENIRKETGDAALRGVVNGLLMNSYLEQGDYKRAQDLLTEFYAAQKTTKPNASESYMAVAGQIIKGARDRVERYRALGLSVSDRMLPLEATNDLEKMRETLELVITQSKEIGADKTKASDAMMLLEEASSSRSMLARDDYDSRRWNDELADTREKVASSRSVVISAVAEPLAATPTTNLVATTTKSAETPPVIVPVGDLKSDAPPTTQTREREVGPVEKQPSESAVAAAKPIIVSSAPPTVKEEPKPAAEVAKTDTPKEESPRDTSPMDVGSLIGYATKQAPAIYPAAAKTIRATGIVKVEVTINEAGDVAEVQKTSGHQMLQSAAKDAIRKWKFKPFVRDGQPVKATGFVTFNFTL